MTDAHDLPSTDSEVITGEVVEWDDVTATEAVEEFEVIDLDDSGILDEVDEDASGSQDDSDLRTDGDVMVLDTWQIQIPATGDDRVDAALARLTEVEGLPPGQHAEVYESVHSGLQDALADLDQA